MYSICHLGCYLGGSHLGWCHMGPTYLFGCHLVCYLWGCHLGCCHLGRKACAGLSSRILYKLWTSGMLSCGTNSIWGVVIWDVIYGVIDWVIDWDVIKWYVHYQLGCHLGFDKGDSHLVFCDVECEVFVRLSSGMLSKGLSSGMYNIWGLSSGMLSRGCHLGCCHVGCNVSAWLTSGMFSCVKYSICGVVIWDVILGVVIWDVVMWDVLCL